MKIEKLSKKDLVQIDKKWRSYDEFLERYNDMKSGKSTCLLVWQGKEPIGHGKIIWRKIPVLEDMYIEESHQSKGHGKKLLKRLEFYAKVNGYNKVKLFVDKNNEKAINLYVKDGFKETGKIKDNEIEMVKII